MDSLTQVVLGASVAEARMGKAVGYRAPLWGAVIGTIPDLDVLGNLWQSEFEAFVFHRSLSHSLLFCLLASPALGWLIHRIYKGKYGSAKSWGWLAFWCLTTHILLDCFTNWGTQVFYPFSEYRVAFNNIFVIDPLYTLPLMACLIAAICLPRTHRWRGFWNKLGLGLSSFYIVLTLTNKQVVEGVFAQELHRQGISVKQQSTYPTPFNNLLWYVVAEEQGPNFYMGLYSLLSDSRRVELIPIPKRHDLIPDSLRNELIERMTRVSKGQYVLSQQADTVYWHDLRFGALNLFADSVSQPLEYTFSFKLLMADSAYADIAQIPPFAREIEDLSFTETLSFTQTRLLGPLWDKMMGN